MGNEMGNRNIFRFPEQDSIENQISQESPSDVVAAMADDMPTSMPSNKGYEDPLDSPSNVKAMVGKDTPTLEAEDSSSAMESDEHVQAMEPGDIQQATTIGKVSDSPAATVLRSIVVAEENENERADDKEAVMLAEECIKVEDDLLKTKENLLNDKGCNGSEHKETEPSKLEIAAMQGEDKCLNEALGVPCLDTKRSCLELDILVDANKVECNVDGLSGRSASTNNVEVNTSEATKPGTENEDADKKDQTLQYDLKYQNADDNKEPEIKDALQHGTQDPATKQSCLESDILVDANKVECNVDGLSVRSASTNNVEVNTTEATKPGTENEDADKKDQNLQYDLKYQNADDNKEPEIKDALQRGTQDPAIIGLPLADVQKSTSSQASDNHICYDEQTSFDGRVDLQVQTLNENSSNDCKDIANGNKPEVEKSSAVLNQIVPLQENGLDDSSMAHMMVFTRESYVNMVESTTIPSYLQSVSETEQDVNILHLPQKTLSTPENGLAELNIEIEQNICSQSGHLFTMNIDGMMEGGSAENEILSSQPFVSEMNSGFIQSESEQSKEEAIASGLEVIAQHSRSETDKHEQDENELDVTVVEDVGKSTSLHCTPEVLQDIYSSLLHKVKDESFNNVVVLETATEVMEYPKYQHSTSELVQNEHNEGVKNAIAVKIIEEAMTLLSVSEAVEDRAMSLLLEVKDESCSNNYTLSTATEELENPNCHLSAIEVIQNKHDNVGSTASVAVAVKEILDSEYSDKRSQNLLHEGENKPCSTAIELSDGEIFQQTGKMTPDLSISVTSSGSEVQEYNFDNREIGISPLILESNDQAAQIENELYSEGSLKRISDKDVKNALGAEVDKPGIGDIESSSESKENPTEDLSAAENQEDVAGTALYEVTKKDANGDGRGYRSIENVTLPMSDKDLPIWTGDSIEATANKQVEPARDFSVRRMVSTGATPDKQQIYASPENQVQPSEYLSCPKLESWNEQVGDDSNTPLLDTAEGFHEEKLESTLQGNSVLDNPKISLERNESGKSHTPLRHLFAEDSVSVPGESLISTQHGSSHVESAQDVWGSPARLVASPTVREKQKTRSIFSQCICCTAIH